MVLAAPPPGDAVDDVWVSGITRAVNGHYQSAQVDGSGTLTPTTTFTDVPGVTKTVTVQGASSYCNVWFSLDVTATVTTVNNLLVAVPALDGVLQAGTLSQGQMVFDDRSSRATRSHFRRLPLSPGAHTIKVQAAKPQAGGTFTVNVGAMLLEVFDLP